VSDGDEVFEDRLHMLARQLLADAVDDRVQDVAL
jgi:hypothetical protein